MPKIKNWSRKKGLEDKRTPFCWENSETGRKIAIKPYKVPGSESLDVGERAGEMRRTTTGARDVYYIASLYKGLGEEDIAEGHNLDKVKSRVIEWMRGHPMGSGEKGVSSVSGLSVSRSRLRKLLEMRADTKEGWMDTEDELKRVVDEVIGGNRLLNKLYTNLGNVHRGKGDSYTLQLGDMGIVFDFDEDLITTHT